MICCLKQNTGQEVPLLVDEKNVWENFTGASEVPLSLVCKDFVECFTLVSSGSFQAFAAFAGISAEGYCYGSASRSGTSSGGWRGRNGVSVFVRTCTAGAWSSVQWLPQRTRAVNVFYSAEYFSKNKTFDHLSAICMPSRVPVSN